MEAIGLILAAGKGTRMKSELPKPLVPLKGQPIVRYIVDAFRDAEVENVTLVVGYKADMIKNAFGDTVNFVDQVEQKGTAHAILQAENKINWQGKDVFVFVGDSPLITEDTVARLYEHHKTSGAHCTFLTADFDMDLPYARVVKDENGKLIKCVEEIDATEEELKIRELLSSHFIFKGDSLFKYIHEVKPNPKNGEFYLTDMITILMEKGLKVETFKIDGYEQLVGLNTPEDVAWAESLLKREYHEH